MNHEYTWKQQELESFQYIEISFTERCYDVAKFMNLGIISDMADMAGNSKLKESAINGRKKLDVKYGVKE